MIQTIRKVAPLIDFGHGITAKQVTAGQPVTIWLQTIYNREVYDFMLQSTGTVTKISDYEYVVAYPAPGSYEVGLSVVSKDKSIALQSNILTLNVTE